MKGDIIYVINDRINGNYCVKTKYSEEWINKNKKEINENGLIKWEYKESCIYDNGRRTIKKECGCGYNNENNDGQAYWPLPSSIRINEWNNRIKYIADFGNNKCHTLSRFNCYLQNSIKDLLKKIIMAKTQRTIYFINLFHVQSKCFHHINI